MTSHRNNELFWLMYFFIICLINFQWKSQLFLTHFPRVIVLFIYFVFSQTKMKILVVINVNHWNEKQWITLDLVLVVQVWRHRLAISMQFFWFRKPDILKTKQDFWMQFFCKVLELGCSTTYLFKNAAFGSPLRKKIQWCSWRKSIV